VTGWLHVLRAARIIREGGIVAYPTEAVYGIGCLPRHEPALERIIAIKHRDAGKGMIVVAADASQLEGIAQLPSGDRGREISSSWPGPVTWIVPAAPGLPALLTGGRTTIAVRVSNHPTVRQLCLDTGSALVSTSANRSGHRPARTALEARRAIGRDVDFVLAGAVGGERRPTEIRDGKTGRILRPGG